MHWKQLLSRPSLLRSCSGKTGLETGAAKPPGRSLTWAGTSNWSLTGASTSGRLTGLSVGVLTLLSWQRDSRVIQLKNVFSTQLPTCHKQLLMPFSLILSPTLFIGKVSYFFCIKWLKQEFFPFGCYKVRWPIAIFVHMIMVVFINLGQCSRPHILIAETSAQWSRELNRWREDHPVRFCANPNTDDTDGKQQICSSGSSACLGKWGPPPTREASIKAR